MDRNGWRITVEKAEAKNLELKKGAVIRNATEDDLHKIMEIERASFKRADVFPRVLFQKYLRELNDGFFVILDKCESIVGYAILGESDGKGYLLSIAIHPQRRNQGFATSLLKFLGSKCYEKGFAGITLEVREDNEKAIEMYRKLGFVEVEKRKCFYEDGADALVMEKRLTTQINQI